jgi:hypothetical protein
MSNLGFQFSSPSSYGDWATYSGFDRTTGKENFGKPITTGFAPPSQQSSSQVPTSFSQMYDQAVAPVKNTYNKLSSVGSNVMSGNIQGAIQAYNSPASNFGLTNNETSNAAAFDANW